MKHILHNLRPNFGCQMRVLLIPVLFSMFTNLASAQAITLIPDPIFEQELIDQGYDTDGSVNGQVLTDDIDDVTDLNFNYFFALEDLTGIQDFSSLKNLQ